MTRLFVRYAGDNDFITVVTAFVKAIAPRIFLGDGPWESITKAEIVALFNETSGALYMLHQHHSPDVAEISLKIREADVFFDEEFEAIPSWQHNHDGCLAVLSHDDILFYVV